MTRTDGLRLLIGFGPFALAYAAGALRRPGRRVLAAVVVAAAWNLWTVLAVNVVAVGLGWWSFAPGLPSLMGVAVEPWLGWVVLWGAVAPLAALDRPVAVSAVAFLWLDLVAMPALEPVVVLGDGWLAGELVALAVAFVPGMLFARWTAQGTHLRWRALLQVVTAGVLVLWLVPSLALEGRGGWSAVAPRPAWQWSLLLQAAALPLALGLRAVIEFVQAGGGTPLPYDPPRRLVRSGPYAYLANPMQTALVVLLGVEGYALGSEWVGGAGAVTFLFGSGLAAWHEDVQLRERFGEEWTRYRGFVPTWIPRLRPAGLEKATLLVAYSCDTCSSVGRWFLVRRPTALTIAPAEDVRDRSLRRITYVSASGVRSTGVAAIARALEHLHLGWAALGWFLALPGVLHLAQLLADVCGPGPQDVAGLPYAPSACPAPGRNGRTG